MIVGGRCVAGKGPSTDAALGCRPEFVPCVASCAETVHANKANPKFTHEILREETICTPEPRQRVVMTLTGVSSPLGRLKSLTFVPYPEKL